MANEQKASLKKAAGELVSGGKDECQVRLKGRECDYWMGKEIGMQNGSSKKGAGKTGAGYNNLRRIRKRQQCKVGREEEGSSSNQPELAALFLALYDTTIEEPLLYLCDKQSLLKAVKRWIGEGTKGNGAPDADILAAA